MHQTFCDQTRFVYTYIQEYNFIFHDEALLCLPHLSHAFRSKKFSGPRLLSFSFPFRTENFSFLLKNKEELFINFAETTWNSRSQQIKTFCTNKIFRPKNISQFQNNQILGRTRPQGSHLIFHLSKNWSESRESNTNVTFGYCLSLLMCFLFLLKSKKMNQEKIT